MPKLVFNSRNNRLTAVGLIDYIEDRIDQYVLMTSDVLFNSLDVTTNANISGNLTVVGNLTVSGNSTVISTQVVELEDNIILINSGETSGSGVSLNLAGIEIERGTLLNFQAVFEETTDLYKIGEVGHLQAVATREDNPLDKGILVFNDLLNRLDSTDNIAINITFSGNTESTSSSTGSVKVVGGIGATGNISLDKAIRFLGTNYSSEITSNISNDLILSPGNHLSIISPVVKLQDTAAIQLGSTTRTISNSGNNILISTTSGDIAFTTATSGKLVLPEQTYIRWGTSLNDLVFDGIDMNLRSTGKFNIFANVTLGTLDPTVSPTTGSLVLNGGLGISGSQDSATSDNGGSLTVAGGVAVKKALRVGSFVDIGDTPTTTVTVPGLGINFRSRNKTLTTNDTSNITFNSFEGGSVVGTGPVQEASTLLITSAPSGANVVNKFALKVDSGSSKFDGIVFAANNTVSSSANTGGLVVNGGVGITNTTDSISANNGGSFTTAGGLAVAKSVKVGDSFRVGETNVATIQQIESGLNFRSLSRIVTTSSILNATFNSFEGGVLDTTGIIPESSTVLIKSPPIATGGGSIQNPLALLVQAGNSKFNGKISCTNTDLDSVKLDGGLRISDTTDSSSVGTPCSFVSLGGASFSKNLLVGNSVKTSNGLSSHFLLSNTSQNSRFSLNLKDTEAGSNSGSNLDIVRYSDAGVSVSALEINRNNSNIILKSTTDSTTSTTGSLVLSGGISISKTTDALSEDNGGTFTTAGGAAVKKKLFVGGNTTLIGGLVSTTSTNSLGKVIIDTTPGSFDISGSNGLLATLGASSSITTSSGSLSLSSANNALILSSLGNTIITSSFGNVNIAGLANTITGTSNSFTSSTGTSVSAGTGGITLNTTDSTQGIKIGTLTSGIPVNIGNAFSETRVNGNFTVGGNFNVLGTLTTIDSTIISIADNAFVVNAAPSGISDGGFLMRRYQTPNDTNTGQVILDTPKEVGAFQPGSTVSSLVLSATSNSGTNYYRGWWLRITSGPASGSTRRIKEYNGATKTAVIYTTLDNNEYSDGLDLSNAPVSGNTYELFDIPYAGIYFSETANEVAIAGVSFDQTSGTFGTPTSYLPLHVQTLITETGLTLGGNLSVKNDDLEVFNIKNNLNETIFNTDSINSVFTLSLPSNAVSSGPTVLFRGKDSISSTVTYTSFKSVINNNVPGSLDGSFVIQGQTGNSGLVEIVRLNGATTSISSKLLCQETTDATTENSGGSLTVAGGAAVKKRMFVGGESVFTKGKTVSNNSVLETSGTLNVNGDIGLYGTSGKLFFNDSIVTGIPTFASRSVGTKIVLLPSVSASSTDVAIGNSSTGMWLSVPTGSNDLSFYLGTTKISGFESTGLALPVVGTGVNLNGAVMKSVSGGKTLFSPSSNSSGFAFTDNTSSLDRVRFNGLGQIKGGISVVDITDSTEGAILEISNNGITDAVTAANGTIDSVSSVSIKQNTLSSTATAVTTSVAASLLVSGAIVKGTNQTFSKVAGIYIDSSVSVNTSGDTIPVASSLFIKDSPTGNNITKSRAILVESGIVEAGDCVILTKGKTVSNNSILENSGTLNVNGDTCIYGTSGKLFFNDSIATGIPTFASRSVGTKVVLLPSVSASSADTAVGNSSTGPWISAPTSSSDISFYLGTLCKVKIGNTGMVLDSGTTSVPFDIACPDNTTGIKLGGGLSSLELLGNGDCVLNSGVGSISLRTGANVERLGISSTGEILVSSTTESTSSSNASSIKTLGGISVAKTVSCGTSLNLDFNQPYVFSGESSGALIVQSKVSSTNNNVKFFTNDGDSTDSNTITIYSRGTPASQTNTESLTLGHVVSEGFVVKTSASGTGVITPLVLQSGSNTGQLKLETDGTVTASNTTASFSSATGAFRLVGGLSISNTTDAVSANNGGTFSTAGGLAVAKKVFVGTDLSVGGNLTVAGNLDTGITSPALTITNATITTTQVRSSLVRNGITRTLTANFTLTPVSQGISHIFDIALPGLSTNLANTFDITGLASGYSADISIENVFVRGIVGTTTIRVRFTSASTALHVIQLLVNYTI